jgi:hypothetical protein
VKRLGSGVQLDACDSCGASVFTSGRDVLGDVAAEVIVDPTPLERMEVAACVIAGRAVYRYEAVNGGALGFSHWATAGRKMGRPNAYLPRHRCGYRFGGVFRVGDLPFTVRAALSDVPPF